MLKLLPRNKLDEKLSLSSSVWAFIALGPYKLPDQAMNVRCCHVSYFQKVDRPISESTGGSVDLNLLIRHCEVTHSHRKYTTDACCFARYAGSLHACALLRVFLDMFRWQIIDIYKYFPVLKHRRTHWLRYGHIQPSGLFLFYYYQFLKITWAIHTYYDISRQMYHKEKFCKLLYDWI